MRKYPRVFGFAKSQDWEMCNTTIKVVDIEDPQTYRPFYITSVGPCRIWWEWKRVNKSTRQSKKVLDFYIKICDNIYIDDEGLACIANNNLGRVMIMNKWFFKLERDVDLGMPTAWSGFVRADTMLDAHTAIKAKLNVDKMPSNTLVQSQRDIINGVQPTTIRRSTKTTAKVKSKPKAFEDVGMTFDQAEALLKRFGLRQAIAGIFFLVGDIDQS